MVVVTTAHLAFPVFCFFVADMERGTFNVDPTSYLTSPKETIRNFVSFLCLILSSWRVINGSFSQAKCVVRCGCVGVRGAIFGKQPLFSLCRIGRAEQ